MIAQLVQADGNTVREVIHRLKRPTLAACQYPPDGSVAGGSRRLLRPGDEGIAVRTTTSCRNFRQRCQDGWVHGHRSSTEPVDSRCDWRTCVRQRRRFTGSARRSSMVPSCEGLRGARQGVDRCPGSDGVPAREAGVPRCPCSSTGQSSRRAATCTPTRSPRTMRPGDAPDCVRPSEIFIHSRTESS